MTFFSRSNLRNIAMMGIVAFASIFLSIFLSQAPTAQANTYVPGASTNGSDTNSNEIEIHYVTKSNGQTLRLLTVGPVNLQAVWTNVATSTSITVNIPNPVSGTASALVRIDSPVTYSSGVKVILEIQARPGASTVALSGINSDSTTKPSNQSMFQVISLGNFPGFTSLENAFRYTPSNMRMSAQLPSTVTSLRSAFALEPGDTEGFNGELSGWNTENVTTIQSIFFRNFSFNQPIGNWNTSNLRTASNAFEQASKFNQNLSSWDMSKVVEMNGMFWYAAAFNNGDQTTSSTVSGVMPLTWNTSSVSGAGMVAMFRNATKFNQSVESFDVSRVTHLQSTFEGATWFNNGDPVGAFDGDASNSNVVFNWTTSNLSTLTLAFSGATNFNQDLSSWDTSRVTTMESAFEGATKFNNGDPATAFDGDSRSSNVSMPWVAPLTNTTALLSTFEGATSFNQDLNAWSISNLTKMERTFFGATKFNNGDPSNAYSGDSRSSDVRMLWSPSNVTSLVQVFSGATSFNQDLNSWDTNKVVGTNLAFEGATNFNNGDPKTAFSGDTFSSNVQMTWNVAALDSASGMFSGATSFNQDLNSWNTSKIQTLNAAFSGATSFNNGDPAGAFEGDNRGTDVRMTWDSSKVQFLLEAFLGATSFNQDLSDWTGSSMISLTSAFRGATSFNNGDRPDAFIGDGFGSNVSMPWNTPNATSMDRMFEGASNFNQDLTNWNTPKVTTMKSMFLNASDFNNGDRIGAYENDPFNSNVTMAWTTSSVSDISYMFSGATSFNQNVSSWNTSQVTTMEYFSGHNTLSNTYFNNGASSQSSNVLRWSTSKVVNMSYAFGGSTVFNADVSSWSTSNVTTMGGVFNRATRFNSDISGWDTSKVTNFTSMFRQASSFNQPIGSWKISAATSLTAMFWQASSFNQDLSNWGPFQASANLDGIFYEAPNMNDSPKNWDMTALSSQVNLSTFTGGGTSTDAAQMSAANIRSIIHAWSFQKAPRKFATFFRTPLYTNCAEYSGFRRLSILGWTWNGIDSFYKPTPPTCSTVTVTWTPVTTITQSFGVVTPSVMATTTGQSGVKYSTYLAGASKCRVDPTTGVITHTSTGSCQVMAYDADPNSDTSAAPGYQIVTFSLPNVTVIPTPGAPVITSVSKTVSAVAVSFNRPTRTGTSTISAYEVGYALTQNGTPTWVSASPMVTSSPSLSFTVSGLVNGTSYWMSVRAINSSGSGDISAAVGPVTPATTPSAPGMASFSRFSSQIAINLSTPLTDGGAEILSYQYRVATSSGAVANASWIDTGSTASAITVSGLTSGSSYFFQVRATNEVGAGSESSVSSAILLTTAPSSPIIVKSTKIGSANTGTVEFLPPDSDGGAAITSYEVRASVNEGDTWTSWGVISPAYDANTGTNTATISGLVGSALIPTYYTFQVRARNSVGYSGLSPQAPSGAEITDVLFGNASATVSFKAAKFDGLSTILGYEYSLRQGPVENPTVIGAWTSISHSVWSTATPTTTASFTVSGLTNGTTYSVWVRAVNAIGGGTAPYQKWFDNTGVPNKPTPSLSFNFGLTALSYSPNASYSPSVTAVSDGAFSYTTSTPLVCSVNSSTGRISGLNAGTCLVTLSQAEGTNFGPATASTQVRIDPSNQPTLTVSTSATTSPYRSTVTLTSSGGAGTGAVTFTPVVSSTCVVAGNVVTLGNAGSFCAVIANKAGDGNYLAATSTQISISTTKIAQSAVSFSNLAEMAAHSSLTVFATGGSGEGVVRYRVSNQGTTGCVLTGTTLTADTSGQCTIEASRATSTNYLVSDSVSQVIQVVKAAQTLRFTTNVPSEPLTGTSYSPAATASSGLSISFSVSGSGCSINAGVVSFTAAGDCVVSAGQAGDASYLTAVTVSQTIAVDRRNQTLAFGSSTQAISSKRYGDAAFVVQASSTDQTASVSFTLSPLTTNNACSVFASGLVIVQQVGDCVIEAYSPQTQAVAAASTISKVISVLPDNASAPFITSVAMGNLSITAGFTPPSYFGGSSVSAYSIVAIDQTPNSNVEVSDSSCGTALVNGQVSCRITGLENGKTYKIKVAAINGAGVGEYSVLSPSVTVATNPAAVQNLRVVQGSTTLAISWDDPDSLGGGTFSAYRVFVKRSASSSYDVNHYFNVPSQATKNITISAETPPDGMTHPGGPALVNGVAYDIKVVTVTTANTEELTGNTAVVNQIPRTTPEPPRLANALVVGNKLVLTWTAPISDGGAAITTYSAVVGNSPCLFANPTDTYCEIALPTAPGNYVFAIAAQNVAGSSTEIQGVFTVASYNSPTPQTSGGSVVTDPVKPSESAPIVTSVSFSVDGKQIFIRGTFLKGISKVVIGGVEARIVSQTSEMIILTAPALAAGSHAVLIHLTDKTILRYEKELVVKGTKPSPVVKKTAKLTGFKPGSSVLSDAMKKSLVKILKANKGSKTLQCLGHTQGPSILKSDARLAMKRAVAVCNFAKQQGFKVVSSSYQNNKKVGAKYRRVDLVFTK